jgi:hypothetical protein
LEVTGVQEASKEGRKVGTLAEARWLAGEEIRRSWLSYPLSGLFALFLAFLVVPSLSGILVVEGFGESGDGFERSFNAFLPDYLFLLLGFVLCVNSFSRDYFLVWTADPFTSRLAFMRSLPISPRSLVAGRMLSMVLALPFTVPAFFVPVYLFSDLRELGASFIWFVGVWVGYGLFGAGLTLLMELGLDGRTYTAISFGMVAVVLVTVALLEWAVALRLVERTVALVGEYGPLPAVVSLVVGAGLFVLLARLTARRVEGRDLAA